MPNEININKRNLTIENNLPYLDENDTENIGTNTTTHSRFEYLKDYTIRSFNSNNCLKVDGEWNQLVVITLSDEQSARWGYDKRSQMIMDSRTKMCLTNYQNHARLKACQLQSIENESQQFAFEYATPLEFSGETNSFLSIEKIYAMHAAMLMNKTRLAYPPLIIRTKNNNMEFTGKTEEIDPINLEEIIGSDSSTPNKVNEILTRGQIKELADHVKDIMKPLHAQYIEGLQISHENKLAQEIREVYCQVLKTEYANAVHMAQFNGLMAAESLELKPCSKLEGNGRTLILHECRTESLEITAVETKCGFQPYFVLYNKNWTIGRDGWSMHPFHECCWANPYITINSRTYSWEHEENSTLGEWIEQKPEIHIKSLKLVLKWAEQVLNDYDFAYKKHPVHLSMELEQGNIMAELVGRIQDTNSGSLASLVMNRVKDNNMTGLLSWVEKLKIIVLSIIGTMITSFVGYVVYLAKPAKLLGPIINKCRKIKKENDELEDEGGSHEMATIKETNKRTGHDLP